MKKVKLTALCGMLTALSVVLMSITTVIPVLMYVLPIITGVIVIVVADIGGKKWALGVYFATSFLSLLLLTDKEASLTYALFFGYYPLIRDVIQRLPKLFFLIIKFLLFNCAAFLIGIAGVLLFGVSAEEYNEFGKATIPVLLGLANIVFILYDSILSKWNIVFIALSKKIKKILK